MQTMLVLLFEGPHVADPVIGSNMRNWGPQDISLRLYCEMQTRKITPVPFECPHVANPDSNIVPGHLRLWDSSPLWYDNV